MENSIKIGDHYYDINSEHFSLEWRESLSNFNELSYLNQFPNLISATFYNTKLNDEGLAHVSNCRWIENLNLQDTEITNDGLKYLQNLKLLKYLRLKENSQLTDDCVPHLMELYFLENLQIQETSITENGLKKLTTLQCLEMLVIQVFDNNYTFEGLLQISRELPDCEILAKGKGSFRNGEFQGRWNGVRMKFMDKAYNIDQIDAVFDLLVSDSSYLKKNWDEYYNKEYKDNRERLLHFDMMAISAFVIKLFQKKKSKDLQSFFDKVEIVLKDSDSEVKNLILAGLIEGIQQICQYENIDMRHEFDPWLSPLTKKNWDEITGFFTFD